jgi:hypothetical protein
MLWPHEKHLSGVVSNLELILQCYGFMIISFDHFSINAIKRERKLLIKQTKTYQLHCFDFGKEAIFNCFQSENKNKQHISFPISKTIKEKLQQNNFSNYFTFSPTEINRTPRSLL